MMQLLYVGTADVRSITQVDLEARGLKAKEDLIWDKSNRVVEVNNEIGNFLLATQPNEFVEAEGTLDKTDDSDDEDEPEGESKSDDDKSSSGKS